MDAAGLLTVTEWWIFPQRKTHKKLMEALPDARTRHKLGLQLANAVGSAKYSHALRLLERGADVNAKDNIGGTPLHGVSPSKGEQVARLLLEKGADVNARDDYGRTPLHRASREWYTSIARLLLDRGADVNAKDREGDTPLHVVNWGDNWEQKQNSIVPLLLERGADINATGKKGRTPLMFASMRGHEDIVRLLLEKGADIDSRDAEGSRAVDVANTKSIKEMLMRKEAARNLVTVGPQTRLPPDVNAEVMKYLVPPRGPLTPAQQAKKNEQYKAMVRAGPAIAEAHQRIRHADEAAEEAETLAAMKTGGKKTTRRNSRREARTTRRLRLKSLKRSHNPAKKFDATFEFPDGHTKTTSFGARGMSDFTKHKDVTRRNRYLQRHGRMGEDWADPTTAGALSRWVLWNKPSFKASLADYKRRFGL
jgi:hypothetical protein